MRRLVCLSLLSGVGLLAAAPASQAVTYGISDQQFGTFLNPLYAPLKLKTARYVAPYDVMSDNAQLQRWDLWYKSAREAKQKILVSFEHSRTEGKERRTPTVRQYEAAMKAFHAAYPSVKEINTWNEVNACQRPGATERQPAGICKASKARLLFQFWSSNKKVFKGATIIPVDVLDDRHLSASSAVKYIKAFKKVAKGNLPKVWGVHNYSDTNRFSQTRFKNILKAIGPKGDIWLLETGGQLTVFGGTKSQKEAKAAKALKCMFHIAKNQTRVKRNYIYQFNGAPAGATFDAGLIDSDTTSTLGDEKKRPGYDVVRKRQSARC